MARGGQSKESPRTAEVGSEAQDLSTPLPKILRAMTMSHETDFVQGAVRGNVWAAFDVNLHYIPLRGYYYPYFQPEETDAQRS